MLARIDMLDVEENLDEVPFEQLPVSWVCPACQAEKKAFTSYVEKKEEVVSEKWVCVPCGYIYDSAIGDPDSDIPSGTLFDDLPEDWECPLCGAPKSDFKRSDDQVVYILKKDGKPSFFNILDILL